MGEAFTKFYQSDNQSRKMLLREKLKSTKMARGDYLATYSPSSLKLKMSW
jgi:hypothetical protein